jgi:hypothetical protein
MFALAGQIPAPVLADLVDISRPKAVQWAKLAARDWSDRPPVVVAEVSVTPALLLPVRGVMGVHMLTAGDGRTDLTRQVAGRCPTAATQTRSRLRQASASRNCAAAVGSVTTCPSTLKTCGPTAAPFPPPALRPRSLVATGSGIGSGAHPKRDSVRDRGCVRVQRRGEVSGLYSDRCVGSSRVGAVSASRRRRVASRTESSSSHHSAAWRGVSPSASVICCSAAPARRSVAATARVSLAEGCQHLHGQVLQPLLALDQFTSMPCGDVQCLPPRPLLDRLLTHPAVPHSPSYGY